MLPPLPETDVLADCCRETANQERLQPWAVEKDFFLTRLIWALAEEHADRLLLKGGTCLSKCDLGYHRMSEDVDLVVPGEPRPDRSGNYRVLNPVAQSLGRLGASVGVRLLTFDGERFHRGAHRIWELRYRSAFLPERSSVIVLEAAIRPVLRRPRRAPLRQLLPATTFAGYEEAFCWALDAAEVRAEKVRAALTREDPEIRDIYDLALLAGAGADMQSRDFCSLVDAKLLELDALPLSRQPPSFGLTGRRRAQLNAGRRSLEGIVRLDEPPLDVDAVLRHYDRIWGKTVTV
jgi:predicted nucleotidyltransferase component of viral defense system